jgi:uncharacterized protein (DUF2235 family)
MNKRIVVCFDGTWNEPAAEGLPPSDQVESNVARFWKSIKKDGVDGRKQISFYDPGVGTSKHDHVIGGVTGLGLRKNIIDG